MISRENTIQALRIQLAETSKSKNEQDISTPDGIAAYHRLNGACIGLEIAIHVVRNIS